MTGVGKGVSALQKRSRVGLDKQSNRVVQRTSRSQTGLKALNRGSSQPDFAAADARRAEGTCKRSLPAVAWNDAVGLMPCA
jgi:hypothetical protein